MHVSDEKRKKLDAKSEKCILVGYSDEQKGYKCYNPRSKQVQVIPDVVFNESASWYFSSPEPEPIVVEDAINSRTERRITESEQPDR